MLQPIFTPLPMVIIFSSEDDYSTNEVIDWLRFYEVEYRRYTYDNPLLVERLTVENDQTSLEFSVANERFDFSAIKSIWYRRSQLSILTFEFVSDSGYFDRLIDNQLIKESQAIHEVVWDLLRSKSINSELDNRLNKLRVLRSASKYAIPTPSSLITSSRMELKRFKQKKVCIVTKNISPGVFIFTNEYNLTSLTMFVTDEMIEALDETFSPILVQEYINKAFEVRSFYLKGEFYSSAIFSQADEQTMVDFRNYNHDKPNRTPPYKLPLEFENKLRSFMNHLGLNSGSIDIIVDTSGRHIFLEVNPIGQFKQVSYPCNYNLESKVAKLLSHVE